MMPASKIWKNYEEAWTLAKETSDLREKQFLLRALTAAVTKAVERGPPDHPFDLLYFVRTMQVLLEQKENLVRVLQGEDLRWWDDG
jgi:hypothetical protein